MKLIIDIPEDLYNKLVKYKEFYTSTTIFSAITNGTPYNPTGDLTEAEKKICKMYLEDLDKTHTCNEYTLIMNLIDNAPTVEHQNEWGKWIVTEVWCPKCHEYCDPATYPTEELNRCPSCGADMLKGENNEKL